RRRDGRQVLDGRAHPARVASDGRAPGSRGHSTGDIIPLTALPDFWTKFSESGKALRSLRLRYPFVRGQLETSQGAEIAGRQAMLNGTFDQHADLTRRGPSPEADPV